MAAAAAIKLTRRRFICLAIAVAAAAALMLALLFIRRSAPPDIKRAFPAGEIVVGVDASFPPFALDDGETLRGLDIGLAQAIAAELGMQVRFLNIGFYALHDALISGRVDLLISALRIDPARMDDLRYTGSYFDNGLVIARAADAPHSTLASLANPRIAYEYASSADAEIRAWEEEDRAIQRLPYELPEYALDALRYGLADAAIVDATTLRLYQSAHSGWAARYRYISTRALRHRGAHRPRRRREAGRRRARCVERKRRTRYNHRQMALIEVKSNCMGGSVLRVGRVDTDRRQSRSVARRH